MRLINTSTGLFEEFIGKNIPKYAILSHTWEDEEVSYKAMTSDPSFRNMKGYQKIMMTCRMASKAGHRFAWVDTCCIDKSSSAELTEAINSMYQWYQRSEICYVYLSDLPASATLEALWHCRWFTRGWTLQELIAPRNIYFFDQDWNDIGSKEDLMEHLSMITGISTAILDCSQRLSSLSVAQKMSWAADRETTRIEDTAYCLLGIFDVNMPLLYGEEGKAFRRLQEEIIKSTADYSIFAWRLPDTRGTTTASSERVVCGILAESPRCFAGSGSISNLPRRDWGDFSISNSGVKTQIDVLSEQIPGKAEYRYVLPLNCRGDGERSVGIRLKKCGYDQFVREDPWSFVECLMILKPNAPGVKYLLTKLPDVDAGPEPHLAGMDHFIAQTRSHALQLKRSAGMTFSDVWPLGRFDREDLTFFLSGDSANDCASVRFKTKILGWHGEAVELTGIVFAVGWSSPDVRQLQFTVVDYQSFLSTSNEMADIRSRDLDAYHLMLLLRFHKVPKASAVRFEFPGTRAGAVVSIMPVRVSDPSICRNEFWRMEFSCKACKEDDVPVVHHGMWNLYDR